MQQPKLRLFPFVKPQPRAAISDMARVIKAPVPHRWGIAGVSIALTYFLISVFISTFSHPHAKKDAEITYVKQWMEPRTQARMRADMLRDAPRLRAEERAEKLALIQAERERRESARKTLEALKGVGL
jgi:hypothetical protein